MRRTDPLRLLRSALPIAILALAIAGAALLVATRPQPEAVAIEEKRYAVRTVVARRTTFRPDIRHFGRLVAAREASLTVSVAGRVMEVSPKLVRGGEVAGGELLLRLDPLFYRTRLAQLEAERARAEALLAELDIEREAAERSAAVAADRLALAERERERQRQLVARRVASPRTLEEAESAVLQRREAAIDALRRRDVLLRRIDQQRAAIDGLWAQIEWAQRELADTELRAPFDAIVASVEVAVGRELRAGEPVARLYDRSSLEIAFSLSDAEFGRLWRDGLLGREVVAELRLGEAIYELRGRVSRIDQKAERAAAGIGVFASLTGDTGGMPLRPDAFLEVRIADVAYPDVFVLPRAALYDADTVYVVDNERLVPRTVETVARAQGLVAVRSGLREGEQVLATRLAEAGPGLAVRIVP